MKVREKKGSECAEGIELLREVIARRVPELNLHRLLDDQVDSVIRSSGELFRDLFLLVSDLVAKQGGFPVDDKKIESVEYKERSHVNVGRVAQARGDSGTADALNREHEQTTRHIEEQAEA